MKICIFDMDGVIFDSERIVFEEWIELSKKYGFENIEIPYMKCIGTRPEQTERIFLDYYGEDFPYEKYRLERSRKYHETYDGGKLPLKKGIVELLSWLKENGYFTAVASSNRTELVRKQIEDAGLLKYFDRIVGGDLVKRSKPEPDVFIEAAKGIDPDDGKVYVIEDSYNGIRAAFKGNMIPIMVPDLVAPDDEMKEKAAYILNDLLEVRDMLKTK